MKMIKKGSLSNGDIECIRQDHKKDTCYTTKLDDKDWSSCMMLPEATNGSVNNGKNEEDGTASNAKPSKGYGFNQVIGLCILRADAIFLLYFRYNQSSNFT